MQAAATESSGLTPGCWEETDDGAGTGDDADADKIQGPHAGPGGPGGEILSQNFIKLLLD
jgi:hypothetical protein